MAMLDATWKTEQSNCHARRHMEDNKNNLAPFFCVCACVCVLFVHVCVCAVCVHTNVRYSVVVEFVTQSETANQTYLELET